MSKEEEKTGKVLLQDNWLARSVYSLNACQNMVYLHVLYQAQKSYLRSEAEFLPEKTYPIEMDYLEVKELIPDKRKRHYKEIERLLTVLRETPVSRKAMEEESKTRKTVIDDYLLDEHGNMVIFLNGLVMRHIISHTSYTALNLRMMQQLKTFKAQRLYETLRFWSQPNEYRLSQEYTVEQLRELLGVKSKYAAYKEFKRNILVKAIEEINERTNMQVAMQEIKHRVNQVKVEKVKFTIYDREPRSYGAKKVKPSREREIEKAKEQFKKTERKSREEVVVNRLPQGLAFSQQVYDRLNKELDEKADYIRDGFRKKQLEEAVTRTLKQLNISKITMKQYAYFIVVLKSVEETEVKVPIDERKKELLNRKKQMDFSLNMEVVQALRNGIEQGTPRHH